MTITIENARLAAMLENYDAETIENAYQLTAYARYGVVSDDDLKEYLANEVAREEVTISDYNEYRAENGYEEFIEMDSVEEFIKSMNPLDAFRMGRYSEFCMTDDYFVINGYGNIESRTDSSIEKEMQDDLDFLKWYTENNIMDDYDADDIIDACNILLSAGF